MKQRRHGRHGRLLFPGLSWLGLRGRLKLLLFGRVLADEEVLPVSAKPPGLHLLACIGKVFLGQ